MINYLYKSIPRKIFVFSSLCGLFTLILIGYLSYYSFREVSRSTEEANHRWRILVGSSCVKRAVFEEAQKYNAVFQKVSCLGELMALRAAGLYDGHDPVDDTTVPTFQFEDGPGPGVQFDRSSRSRLTAYWGDTGVTEAIIRECGLLSRLDPFLEKIGRLLSESVSVYVVTRSGVGRCITRDAGGRKRAEAGFTGKWTSDIDWNRIDDGTISWNCAGEHRFVTARVPVSDKSGTVRAFVGLEFSFGSEDLSGTCSLSYPSGEAPVGGQFSFLLDPNGFIMGMTDRFMAVLGLDGARKELGRLRLTDSRKESVRKAESLLRESDSCEVATLDLDGAHYLLASTVLDASGWHLVVGARENTALSNHDVQDKITTMTIIDRVWKTHLMLTSIILLLMSLVIYLTVSRILTPIRQLTQSASEVAGGNFTVRSPVDAPDELGGLAEAFNTMMGKIQWTFAQEQEAQKALETIVRERTWKLEQANADLEKAYNELEESRDALEQKVETRTQELMHLNEYMSITEVRERRRVAEYLHDGVAQTLGLCVSRIKTFRERDEAGKPFDFEEMEASLEKSLREIRSLTYQLSPPILHDFNLDIALGWLVEEMNKQYRLALIYANDLEVEPRLDERAKEVLYRSVHELIMNVVKHAGSPDGVIRIFRDESGLNIEVQDFGKGFESSDAGKMNYSRFGLFSTTERLRSIQGTCTVTSEPGYGTRVVLTVPSDLKND